MPDGQRFTMLEECRPVNPPPGTRRTVSLAQSERFTMLPEVKPIQLPSSNPARDLLAAPPAPDQTIEHNLYQLLDDDLQPNRNMLTALPPLVEEKMARLAESIADLRASLTPRDADRALLLVLSEAIQSHERLLEFALRFTEIYRLKSPT
jgi:hypothetical protein